jgi:hypothetical protein
MLRYMQALLVARREHNRAEEHEFAIRCAKEYEGSPIGDYAARLAERTLRTALHEDARTHVGRIGRPVI